MSNDSILKTFIVAFLLCLVCAIVVSTAAVKLRPAQQANKALDMKQNILKAAGMMAADADVVASEVDAIFENIQVKVVDLDTGEFVDSSVLDVEAYDQRKAAKDPSMSRRLTSEEDGADIRRREKYAKIYVVETNGQMEKIILPMHGYGLWSTLYGFIALESDLNTIIGLGFYDHGETPGLGGEVDNPRWKSQWKGKKVFDENGNPALGLKKGGVIPNSPAAIYNVDGLSGATLTSTGVTNLLRFWLGDLGFKPLIKRIQKESL